MYKVSVEDKISSAHQLRGYKGKCEKLHGHNWKIILTVKGDKLDAAGMLIDFHELRDILSNVLSEIDHTNINEVLYFLHINPTSENIAYYIFHRTRAMLDMKNFSEICVDKVCVYETDKAMAEYSE
ncbi:MAG: 6-carboxytetrahydropterin synthase QueD [Spirochaetes bacterium]|nr:6-carboxytetrahydropterin synthase QueD [Spirochaetota bacterium]